MIFVPPLSLAVSLETMLVLHRCWAVPWQAVPILVAGGARVDSHLLPAPTARVSLLRPQVPSSPLLQIK